MLPRLHRWTVFLALGLVAVIGLVTPSVTSAQSKTLRWHRWDADIQINADGTFDVREVYEIEFIGGDFTFGFRNIPRDQYTELRDFSVSEGSTTYVEAGNERPNTFSVTQDSTEYVVNWFYPPTSNATRVFTVEYTVVGGIIINADVGDRFFWKAVGPDHDFPVESSTVVVRMPPGAQIDTTLDPAFFGPSATYSVSSDLSTVTYQAANISAGQAFEVGVRFPHGIVPDVKPPWQAAYEREQTWNDTARPMLNLGLGSLALILLVGGLGGVYLLWLTAGRDPDIGAVPSHLTDPPSELPPGLAGTLVDEKADLQDIIATVVDLARRGVIEMEERDKKILGITASKDFVFRKKDAQQELRGFEELLVREMFSSRDEVELDDLREKFYTSIPRLQRELYAESVREGLFPVSPRAVRGRYLGLGIAGLVLSMGVGFCAAAGFADRIDAILCPFMSLGLASIGLMIVSGAMPAKTRRGAEDAAKWKAFKAYLSNAERFADLKEVTDQFDRYLPYAIAFGLERSWINKFARIPSTPMPGWYIPIGHGFYGSGRSGSDGDVLGKATGAGSRDLRGEAVRPGPSLEGMSDRLSGGLNAMSAGLVTMLNSTASTFTSVPHNTSSGGGFSGGGFSGGGFSGGGGGGGGGAGFG